MFSSSFLSKTSPNWPKSASTLICLHVQQRRFVELGWTPICAGYDNIHVEHVSVMVFNSMLIQNRTTSQMWIWRRQWSKDGRCWFSGASFKHSPWTIFLSVKVFKTLDIWSRRRRIDSSCLSLHSAFLCWSHLNTTLLHSVSEKSIFQVKMYFHPLGPKFWLGRN